MSDGIKLSETPEVPQESGEVNETKQQLDRAAFEPEAAVEKSSEFKEAEAVEAAFTSAMETAPAAKSEVQQAAAEAQSAAANGSGEDQQAEIADQIEEAEEALNQTSDEAVKEAMNAIASAVGPADRPEAAEAIAEPVTLEGAPEAGSVTIDRSARAEAAGGQRDVMIDTVPLPESPAEQAESAPEAGDLPQQPPDSGTNDGITPSLPASDQGAGDGTPTVNPVDVSFVPAVGQPSPGHNQLPNINTVSVSETTQEKSEFPQDRSSAQKTTGEGTDPVQPADPIQGVTAVGTSGNPDLDYSAEMSGAAPGEIRGFENPDGSPSDTFMGDGSTTPTEIFDRLTAAESPTDQGGAMIQEVPQDQIVSSPSGADGTSPESETADPSGDETQIYADVKQSESILGAEGSTTGEIDARTAKILGQTPSGGTGGMGLPIDDDTGGDSSDDESDESSDTPPPPPETGTGTGVSPNLPASDLISPDNPSEVQAEFTDTLNEISSGNTPIDVNSLVQSALRESYTENNQDLAFHAQKVKFFNECKEEVRNHLDSLRENAIEVGDDEQLTIPITTTEVSDDGTELEVKQDLSLTLAEAQAFLAIETGEPIPENDGSSAERTSSGKSFDDIPARGVNQAADAVMSAGNLAAPFIPGGSVLSAAMSAGTSGDDPPPDTDSSDGSNGDSGDGDSDTPPPPPETGTGTGVSPNLPGTSPASGNASGLTDLPDEDGSSPDQPLSQQEASISTQSVQDGITPIVQDANTQTVSAGEESSPAVDTPYSIDNESIAERIGPPQQETRDWMNKLTDKNQIAEAIGDHLEEMNELEPEPGEEPESDSDWEGVASGDGCMPAWSENNRELVNDLSDLRQEMPKESVALADQISDKVWELALPINKDTYIYELTKEIVQSETDDLSPLAEEEIVAVSLSNTVQSVRTTMSSLQENSEEFSLQEAKDLWSSLLDFESETGADDEESFNEAFENFDQKAAQLFNTLSTVLTTIKEMKTAVDRNET